jgi:hypothetical protein
MCTVRSFCLDLAAGYSGYGSSSKCYKGSAVYHMIGQRFKM